MEAVAENNGRSGHCWKPNSTTFVAVTNGHSGHHPPASPATVCMSNCFAHSGHQWSPPSEAKNEKSKSFQESQLREMAFQWLLTPTTCFSPRLFVCLIVSPTHPPTG